MASSLFFTSYRLLSCSSGAIRTTSSLTLNRMSSNTEDTVYPEDFVVSCDEVIRFIGDCMHKAGANQEDARVIAHHLMIADYRGHFSHGMNRMPMYVGDIECKLTDPHAKPELIKDFQVSLANLRN